MIALIVNPVAGNGRSLRVLKSLEAALHQRGTAYTVMKTTAPGEAAQLAAKAAAMDGCEAILSVGGDGTAYETACGLLHTSKPLGIIPAGTGNDFIKTIKTPADPVSALEFILTHEPRPADIGVLNERRFLNVCGTGFDVTVLDYAESAKKHFHGLLPYLIGLIKAIAHYRPVHIALDADGVHREADVLVCSIANGRFIGGGIPICPVAEPDDGKLDLVIVPNVPRRRIPRYLPGLLRGRLLKFGFTEHLLCDRISVESPGMRLNVDGEIFSMDRAEFSLEPGGLLLYW